MILGVLKPADYSVSAGFVLLANRLAARHVRMGAPGDQVIAARFDAVCLCILTIAGWQTGAAEVAKSAAPVSLSVTPEKLDFGTQYVGSASAPQSVTLTNVSAAPVTIRDITISGIDFTETNNCPGQLAPGAQCGLQLVFKPAIAGQRIGTVVVTDSDPHTIFIVLAGSGR